MIRFGDLLENVVIQGDVVLGVKDRCGDVSMFYFHSDDGMRLSDADASCKISSLYFAEDYEVDYMFCTRNLLHIEISER